MYGVSPAHTSQASPSPSHQPFSSRLGGWSHPPARCGVAEQAAVGGHGNGGVADGLPGALELLRPSLVGGGAELVGERPHRLARGWTRRKPPKRGEQPLQVLLEDRLLPNLCDMTSPQVKRSSSPSAEESVESCNRCPPHRGELPRCRQPRQLGRLRFGCEHTHVEQVAHARAADAARSGRSNGP